MTKVPSPGQGWRTSSYTADGKDCVEVLMDTTATSVRDTKNRAGGILTFPAETMAAFIAQVKGDCED